MSKGEYLKEKDGDTCPVIVVDTSDDEESWSYWQPRLREKIDEDIDNEPPVVEKEMCKSCEFRSTIWITKEGKVTVLCQAKRELEDK